MSETFKDILADDSRTPLQELEHSEMQSIVGAVLKRLPKREKEIVLRYYGFEGNKGESLNTIALDFGLTKEAIRKIKLNALVRLRKSRKVEGLRA